MTHGGNEEKAILSTKPGATIATSGEASEMVVIEASSRNYWFLIFWSWVLVLNIFSSKIFLNLVDESSNDAPVCETEMGSSVSPKSATNVAERAMEVEAEPKPNVCFYGNRSFIAFIARFVFI